MLDYLIPKKTGFEPNQYRNFGFEKSSGIPGSRFSGSRY
jgi:hypothetical protein